MVLGGFRSFHVLVTTDLGKNLEIFQRRQKELVKTTMEDKILKTINMICLNFSPFPPLP